MAYSNNSVPLSIFAAVVALVFLIGGLVVYSAVTGADKVNSQAGTTAPAAAPSTSGSGAH